MAADSSFMAFCLLVIGGMTLSSIASNLDRGVPLKLLRADQEVMPGLRFTCSNTSTDDSKAERASANCRRQRKFLHVMGDMEHDMHQHGLKKANS